MKPRSVDWKRFRALSDYQHQNLLSAKHVEKKVVEAREVAAVGPAAAEVDPAGARVAVVQAAA